MLSFLSGGGELGAAIRSFAWAATPLGPPAAWPQELKTLVGVMLAADQPMFTAWGAERTLIYNDRYMPMLGRKHGAALGRPFFDVWPEVREPLTPLFDRVFDGEPIHMADIDLMLNRDGALKEAHFAFSYTPVRGETGAVVGLFCTCTETTDRIAAERALRDRDAYIRLLIESTAEGFYAVDREGVTTLCNPAFLRMLGFPSEADAVGRKLHDVIHHTHADGSPYPVGQCPIYRCAGDGVPAHVVDEPFFRLDGSILPVEYWAHPIIRDGEVCGAICTFIDVTERRAVEARRAGLLELYDRLRDMEDPAEMAFAAAEVIGRTLGVDAAGYATFSEDGEALLVERDWTAAGVSSLAGHYTMRDYGSFVEDLKRGDVVVVTDVASDARTSSTTASLDTVSARALVNLPFVEQGRLAAMFYANSAAPRDWSAEDVGFMRNVAERTRAAVERRRAEISLKRLNETLEQQVDARTRERNRVWNNAQDLIVIIDTLGVFKAINPAVTRVLGWTAEDMLGRPVFDFVHPEDQALTGGALAHATHDQLPVTVNRYRHKDGGYRWLSWVAAPEGELIYATARHVTIEKQQADALAQTQEALRQSQKMEALGQLTGGIAHDFNNLLTGIVGSLDIIRRRLASNRLDDIPRFMDAASTSAHRAAALTHRLLAFARRQSLDTKPLDVNQLVLSLEEILHRTLGEQVELRTVLAPTLQPALSDANQLENAILNLAINARDAMPDGGRLTIETAHAHLDEAYARLAEDVVAGDYVAVCVSDTGTGMPAEVIERAFDPFFTTKPIGQGTGLGLSMIYGFAKQSCGHVRIYSEVGRGTTVKLYLPRAPGGAPADPSDAAAQAPRGRGETVLVVEDEETVRLLVVEVLEELGYRHLEAADARGAIPLLRSDQRIDLLVTDVGLPHMNGRQLAEIAREARPELKVLFVTGYAENAAVRGGFLAPGMDMLTKPFALDGLAAKIREMIER